MIDLLGSVVIELQDDPSAGPWCDKRVRGEEPAPGDAMGPGDYKRWIRVQHIGSSPRLQRTPVQFPRFAISTFGLTPQDAMAGYGYASDALHGVGCRLRANGIGIYISFEDAAPDPERDPDTKQPFVTFVAQVIAPTQVVPV